jgi:hypothetical protein
LIKAINAPSFNKAFIFAAYWWFLFLQPQRAVRHLGAKRSRTPHKSARCYAQVTSKYPDENR